MLALGCLGFAGCGEAKEPKKFLVVTVTKGFRHSSIPTAEKIIGDIAQKTGDFSVDFVRKDEEMATKMTVENLKKYDGVIFANTTGDLPLPDVQGFLDWIKSGKAFVGMHSATDTFRGHTPLHPYVDMIGGEFQTHPPGLQKVECINEDPDHPACDHFGKTFKVEDEIYILNGFKRETVHGLLRLNQYPGGKEPGDFPVAWCKKYGQGNVFYTSLGHAETVWESSDYQKHILGGIRWAAGLEKGDATPQAVPGKPGKKVTD
jgi:type 1 glutamine amidotransferase